MLDPREIAISDYDYSLPDDRVAKYPLTQRDSSRLLVYRDGQIDQDRFFNLPSFIPSGALMLLNNTRVIQARLHFRKETGALIEVFCLEPDAPRDYAQNFAAEGECVWSCLVGNSKKWKTGRLSMSVKVGQHDVCLECERVGESASAQRIRFIWNTPGVRFADILDAVGELPIPPYLNRATEESDRETYQTVYSHIKGSVAAPTAGLHFTPTQFEQLQSRGVEVRYLTLHVGAGTFKPVKAERIEGHEMHTEFISVPREVIAALLDQMEHQVHPFVVAVGTTSVRTLESLYYMGVKLMHDADLSPEDLIVHQWEPYERTYDESVTDALHALLEYLDAHTLEHLVSATQILIAPSFRFRIIDAVVTNFHMPQSTLLLLVSALVDADNPARDNWRRIYDYALSNDFRFLSYGDSSILFRKLPSQE